MARKPGSKDLKPRKKRTDTPKSPLIPYARDAGRTITVSINGCISPQCAARLSQEGRGLSKPEQLDSAIKRLIAYETGIID